MFVRCDAGGVHWPVSAGRMPPKGRRGLSGDADSPSAQVSARLRSSGKVANFPSAGSWPPIDTAHSRTVQRRAAHTHTHTR